MAGENWTFWLMMMNYALGVITLAALVLVVGAVSWELLGKRAQKLRELEGIDSELHAMFHGEPHALSVPGLGFTMADGGEKIAPAEAEASNKKPPRE
jgi:hypothetical protein